MSFYCNIVPTDGFYVLLGVRALADKGRLQKDHDGGTFLVLLKLTPPGPTRPGHLDGHAACRLDDEPTRIHVPLLVCDR